VYVCCWMGDRGRGDGGEECWSVLWEDATVKMMKACKTALFFGSYETMLEDGDGGNEADIGHCKSEVEEPTYVHPRFVVLFVLLFS
jgi:hypothetical protein